MQAQESFSEGEAISEPRRQPGRQDFLLSLGQIIREPSQPDRTPFLVKHNVGSAPVAVSWLTNTAHVDEVFFPRFQHQLFEREPNDGTVFNVGSRCVSMTEEAKFRGLLGKAGRCIQLIQDVTPSTRVFQSGVDDHKSVNFRNERKRSEPALLGWVQLITCPLNSGFGQWVEAFQGAI